MPLVCPDYYWTLGLSSFASPADVTKAYRKLAWRWHPSNFPANKRLEAEAKFREITEAFEVLSDKDRRMVYDKHGRQGLLDCEDVGISITGLVRLPSTSPSPSSRPRGMASFRDPNDVFFDIFGCHDVNKATLHHQLDGDSELVSRFLYDDKRFQHSFPGFTRPQTMVATKLAPTPAKDVVTSFKGSVFSGPTDSGDYRTVAQSERVVNGQRIVTKRNILNGCETVVIEEDGRLVSKTVDGAPRDPYEDNYIYKRI